MKVRNFDLNLLKVFEAMVEHRSVHGVSRALWMKPSAVCHALGLLRDALSDPLFVPGESGLVPTSRALEVAPQLLSGLKHIRAGLRVSQFRLEATKRILRLAVSDDAVFLLCPVLRLVLDSSRFMSFDLHHLPGVAPLRALQTGRLDVVVGRELAFDGVGVFRSTRLYVEEEVLVARPGHPLCRSFVSKHQLASYPRASVHRGCASELKEREGAAALSLPLVLVDSYTLLPALLASTDMFGSMPKSSAAAAIRAGHVSPISSDLPAVVSTVDMVWHARSDGDACMQWLLKELAGARVTDVPTSHEALLSEGESAGPTA